MLNICDNISKLLDFKFNVSKTSAIRISSRYKTVCRQLLLYGESIQYVNKIKYLGVFILSGKTFNCCYENAKSKFYRSFNSIYAKSKTANSELVTVHLMKAYSLPMLLYASDAICPNKATKNKYTRIMDCTIGKNFNTYDNLLIKEICSNLGLNLQTDI